MKKRILALFLLLALALTMVAGCAQSTGEEDLGAQVRAFFVSEVYDFDPAMAYTNDDAMKVMSLIYETLFCLDENGNLQYGLADSYEFYENRGKYYLDIHIRDTYWNDGSKVTAADAAYAWQRILDPNFPSQAATLLYDIHHAKEAKLNMNSITKFDAGIFANEQTLTVTFKQELSEEGKQNFLRNLTSVALAPIKENAVTVNNRDNWWTKRVSSIVTSGPFAIRAMEYGLDTPDSELEFRLERNSYYRRPQGSTNAVDTYVTPHKFLTYWNAELDEEFTKYMDGSVFYVGDIPLEKRAELLKDARVSNLLSTYTYVLDNDDPVFANAKVRRALSMALDRALLSEVTGGLQLPATGLVSHGVLNGASGSFSGVTAKGENAILSSADAEAAAALIREAKSEGYKPENAVINILVRDNAEERAIAEKVEEAWTALFKAASVKMTVNVHYQNRNTIAITEADTLINLPLDTVQEAYSILKWDHDPKAEVDADVNGFAVGGKTYNVIGIDYQMLSPDAFSALAGFSQELSGNGVLMGGYNGAYEVRGHVCGYSSEAYDALIEQAYNEMDMAKRNDLLHQAEDMLLADMPVVPLLFNRSAALVSGELKRVYTNYYGYAVFTRTELRNYHKYIVTEEQ